MGPISGSSRKYKHISPFKFKFEQISGNILIPFQKLLTTAQNALCWHAFLTSCLILKFFRFLNFLICENQQVLFSITPYVDTVFTAFLYCNIRRDGLYKVNKIFKEISRFPLIPILIKERDRMIKDNIIFCNLRYYWDS